MVACTTIVYLVVDLYSQSSQAQADNYQGQALFEKHQSVMGAHALPRVKFPFANSHLPHRRPNAMSAGTGNASMKTLH